MLKKYFFNLILLSCFLLIGVSATAQINFYSQMDITIHASGYRMVTNCAFTKTELWTDPTWSTYSWSTGDTDDAIELDNFGSPYTASGFIYLTVTDALGASTTDSIYMNSDLYANQTDFLWGSGPGSVEVVCQGGSAYLYANAVGPVPADTLFFSDGSICHYPTSTCYIYPSTAVPGVFGFNYTRYRVVNGCRYISNGRSLVVLDVPDMPVISQTGVTLYATSGPKFRWYDSSMVKIAGAIDTTYTPPVSGNYYCRAYSTSSVDTCFSPLAGPFNFVSPAPPTPILSASGGFGISATSGPSFRWYGPGMVPIAGATSSLYTPVVTGDHYARACTTVSSMEYCSNLSSSYFFTPSPAKPVLSVIGSAIAATEGPHHFWYDNSITLIAGAPDTLFVPTVTGNYYARSYVIMSGDTFVSDLSDPLFFNPISVIPPLGTTLQTMPIPANDRLLVKGLLLGDQLELVDLHGRLMMSLRASGVSEELALSSLTEGIYFLNVRRGDVTVTRKVPVIH